MTMMFLNFLWNIFFIATTQPTISDTTINNSNTSYNPHHYIQNNNQSNMNNNHVDRINTSRHDMMNMKQNDVYDDDPEEPLSIIELSVEEKVELARRNVKRFTSKKTRIKEINVAFQRHEVDIFKPDGSRMNRVDFQDAYLRIKLNKNVDPTSYIKGQFYTYKLGYNKKTDEFNEQSLFMPYYRRKL